MCARLNRCPFVFVAVTRVVVYYDLLILIQQITAISYAQEVIDPPSTSTSVILNLSMCVADNNLNEVSDLEHHRIINNNICNIHNNTIDNKQSLRL